MGDDGVQYTSRKNDRSTDRRSRAKPLARVANDGRVGIQWSKIFPQRLTDNYKSINLLLKSLKTADKPSVEKIAVDLEALLNDSLPQTTNEHAQRIQEFLHFHKDSEGYYQHLLDSKLRFLVLWTDYKYITKHFRIRNVIHVRWTGTNYECQLFDQSKRIKYQAVNSTTEASDETTDEVNIEAPVDT